jgi:hypothetical protein
MVEEETLRYTVEPNIGSKIVMKTLPGGICTLHIEDEDDPIRSLKFFADQDGMTRFHVRPAIESDVIAKMVIDCEVEANITRFPLELRSSPKPTPEMPAPPLERAVRRPNGASVLPALSEDDAFQLSDEELLRRGYPPRPDPQKVPDAFGKWQRAFSLPLTFVEPKSVSNPGISHGPGHISEGPGDRNSDTWSGFLLDHGNPFCVVTGVWNVPSVTGEYNMHTYSSFWVGLDGFHDKVTGIDVRGDLPQAGTEQQSLDLLFESPTGRHLPFSFSIYYAWTQFWDNQIFEQVVPNLHVNPGDEMYVGVWMGNEKSVIDLNGDCIFSLTNMTTRQSQLLSTSRDSKVVSGRLADWIMERPTLNHGSPGSSSADLANYNSATMVAYASGPPSPTGFGPAVWYSSKIPGHDNPQLTMKNGTKELSSVTQVNYGKMLFSWHAFH